MTTTSGPQGYVLDTSYADKFFQELSPAWLNYVRAVNGVSPRPLDQPFTYLELGAGFCHSTVVNAGAFASGEFHACDFNPEHIAGGRRHAQALGLPNIAFHEASFERLAEARLPMFDFIVLHGVYSWVEPSARAAVRRIIRDKLAPGGLVYVSYNCMPGWASEIPVRRLLVELTNTVAGESGEKVRQAIQVLGRMNGQHLRFFELNPEAARAVESYARVPPSYLAHEFLNETWQPFYSVDVIDELAADAGVTYLGSATLADNHPMLLVDEAAVETMQALASPRQQHLALDFATNRRFRRDVFVHGGTPRSPAEATRALSDLVIGSVADPQHLSSRVRVPRGQISFQPDFIEELKGLLREGSTTIGDAAATLGRKTRNTAEVLRNLVFLVAGGALAPFAKAYRYALPAEVHRPANKLVERSLAYIIENRIERAIPSELLGGGVVVSPLEAIAIIELLSGTEPGVPLVSKLKSIATQFDAAGQAAEVGERVATTLLPSLARLKLVD